MRRLLCLFNEVCGTLTCRGTCEVVRGQLAVVDTLLPVTSCFVSPLNFYETGFDEDKRRELNSMLTVTPAFISPEQGSIRTVLTF